MTTIEANTVVVQGAWEKPPPNIDQDNKAFWDGLAHHELLLWTCDECGAAYWPKTYCVNHPVRPFADGMRWKQASGQGKLFAYNVHHWSFHPGFKDDVPYAYALVELDEGPLISSMIIGRLPTADDVGGDVEIVYEDHPDVGFTIPRFRLRA